MAKIKRYTEKDGGYHGELGFFCPGCNCKHFINDKETNDPSLTDSHIWTFNGDFEKPTIRASVLLYGWKFNPSTGKHDIRTDVCHSFITNGRIQFLNDCHHKLAGKTVELPEIEL